VARLFGTDGVRGVINENLNAEMALKLGMAICTTFGEGSRFLVGRDVRLGGDILIKAVVSGLESGGCTPYLCGYAPTPAVQYAIRSTQLFDGGIVVTASHNPPMYNGIKVIDSDGIEVPREKEREIEKVFFEERFSRVPWFKGDLSERMFAEVLDIYVKGIIEQVDKNKIREKHLTVVFDGANSVGSLVIPRVIRLLGGKPISLNAHLDPYFPGREPEPTPETLALAAQLVKASSADFGVGVDGDADRAIFIDDRGNVYWGDRTAVVLAPFLKERNPELPPVVYTGVSSSSFIEDLLREHGIKVVWLKVGSVDISRELVDKGGLLGFEENGGIMYPPHQPVRDAAMGTALMMQLIAEKSVKLSEEYSRFPRTYVIKTKYPLTRDLAVNVVERVKQEFSSFRTIPIDGVKVIFDDGWLLVRPSGTEPVLRVMIEMLNEKRAKEIKAKIESTIHSIRGVVG